MSMSSPTKAVLSEEYLQANSTHTNDGTKRSPLELLAQTCSSIGNDCLMTSTHITKSPRKNSSPSPSNPTPKKSTRSLKSKTSSSSPSISSPQLDPSLSYTRSPLPYYLYSPQHSYSTICTIRGCLQCETLRYFLSNSLHASMYPFECKICNARFYSSEQLIEHIQYNHQPRKISNQTRFHPYSKASNRSSRNDQVPLFYPNLSMSSPLNQIIGYFDTHPRLYK